MLEMVEDYDYLMKIVLVGDAGVGKSNLALRFTQNEFILKSQPSIGVEFHFRSLEIEKKHLKVQIWDVAGDERFRVGSSSTYYRGAVGGMMVYDISKYFTFENVVTKYLKDLQANIDPSCTVMLVGNKSDLNDQREVTFGEGKLFADQHNLMFLETSAFNSHNVENAFINILTDVVAKEKNLLEIENFTSKAPISVKVVAKVDNSKLRFWCPSCCLM